MADSRPNVILIITDQQRFDTIAALGSPWAVTPHIDRLVREGVSFSHCFVTAPSCAPSRASLFTGLFPHTTGVFRNGDLWRHGWVEQLAASGYHCVNVGKMHTTPFTTPMGFHERYVVENKDRYLEGRYFFDEWDKALAAHGLVKQQRELYRLRPDYRERLGAFEWELPEALHSDLFVGGLARWWIGSYPRTEPLFLQIGFPGPHPPYDPVPRALRLYDGRDLPLAPVTDEEVASQPTALRRMIRHNCEVDHDSIVHLEHPTREQRLRQRRHYMANVTMIDEQVGLVLEALALRGYLESSVVIFTSDHGDCLGDHGHSQKWTMYDAVTRVPAVVWAPRRFAGGRSIDGLCQLMDLGPTILELAGCQPPYSMEARSLLPALAGDPAFRGRDAVYAEHARDGTLQGTELMTMVREPRWKLVAFVDSPQGQLFDLERDPEERRNLWDDAAAAAEKNRLLARITDWHLRGAVRTAAWKAPWR
jgi:arylsulfatase